MPAGFFSPTIQHQIIPLSRQGLFVNDFARQNLFRNPFRKCRTGSLPNKILQMSAESAQEPIALRIIQRLEFELFHYQSPLGLHSGPINPRLGPIIGKLEIFLIFQ